MHIAESKKFSHWLNRLKDDSAVHQIQSWAYRMARSQELLGDWKRIGPELIEFRFSQVRVIGYMRLCRTAPY